MALAHRLLPMSTDVIGPGLVGIVSDAPAVRAFYRDAIGLPPGSESGECAYFAAGETGLIEILSSQSSTAANQGDDAPAVGLLVVDLDSFLRQLDLSSVGHLRVFERRDDAEVHRWVYFEDPCGTVLLVVERTITAPRGLGHE